MKSDRKLFPAPSRITTARSRRVWLSPAGLNRAFQGGWGHIFSLLCLALFCWGKSFQWPWRSSWSLGRTSSGQQPAPNRWVQLQFVKMGFSGGLSYRSRRMTSLEKYIRNIKKCVIFKVAGYLPLRFNLDSIRQASPCLKIKFGLIDMV